MIKIRNLRLHLHIKEKLDTALFSLLYQNNLEKFGGYRFEFIRKIMHSLVNTENY